MVDPIGVSTGLLTPKYRSLERTIMINDELLTVFSIGKNYNVPSMRSFILRLMVSLRLSLSLSLCFLLWFFILLLIWRKWWNPLLTLCKRINQRKYWMGKCGVWMQIYVCFFPFKLIWRFYYFFLAKHSKHFFFYIATENLE